MRSGFVALHLLYHTLPRIDTLAIFFSWLFVSDATHMYEPSKFDSRSIDDGPTMVHLD